MLPQPARQPKTTETKLFDTTLRVCSTNARAPNAPKLYTRVLAPMREHSFLYLKTPGESSPQSLQNQKFRARHARFRPNADLSDVCY
jgi:hypothetical protein